MRPSLTPFRHARALGATILTSGACAALAAAGAPAARASLVPPGGAPERCTVTTRFGADYAKIEHDNCAAWVRIDVACFGEQEYSGKARRVGQVVMAKDYDSIAESCYDEGNLVVTQLEYDENHHWHVIANYNAYSTQTEKETATFTRS